MIDRVVQFIKKYNLQNKSIVVGFSGGYDSMCLLDIMSKIRALPEFFEMHLIAAHFNHNWRGEESLKEQEICRLFAKSKGIEFYTKTATGDIKKTENDARIARYEFFDEVIEEYDADAIFTAHNYDDNAETVLYRIIKGTGLTGLQGISVNRQIFYRPFLETKRAEILEYCNKYNLTPNDDSSNSNINYKRNYIRLNVIPALEKINENVKESLNTLATIVTNESEMIEAYLAPHREKVFNDMGQIVVPNYINLIRPAKLRFLHEYVRNLNLDYDYKRICEIYDFIEKNCNKKNGTTLSLASALWLYADNKIVETIPNKTNKKFVPKNILVEKPGDYKIDNAILRIKEYKNEKLFVFPPSTSTFAYVNLLAVEFPINIRTRIDGDTIVPFGMKGSMKLKKYMNSKGIPKHKRDEIYLLCKDSEVLWAPRIGINNKIAVQEKPTHVLEWIEG